METLTSRGTEAAKVEIIDLHDQAVVLKGDIYLAIGLADRERVIVTSMHTDGKTSLLARWEKRGKVETKWSYGMGVEEGGDQVTLIIEDRMVQSTSGIISFVSIFHRRFTLCDDTVDLMTAVLQDSTQNLPRVRKIITKHSPLGIAQALEQSIRICRTIPKS